MSWKINYSKNAKTDLQDIYEYIAYELFEPQYAKDQVERIMASVRKLEDMPMRFAVYKEEPWKSKGVRFVPVDNYLVFYLPNEDDKCISIVRIMYGGRDIKKQIVENE